MDQIKMGASIGHAMTYTTKAQAVEAVAVAQSANHGFENIAI
jgi:hypothetical protein